MAILYEIFKFDRILLRFSEVSNFLNLLWFQSLDFNLPQHYEVHGHSNLLDFKLIVIIMQSNLIMTFYFGRIFPTSFVAYPYLRDTLCMCGTFVFGKLVSDTATIRCLKRGNVCDTFLTLYLYH